MAISSMKFNRIFSLSMYKNLKIKLGEMTFLKDFTKDVPGDLYPAADKSPDCTECIENNLYTLVSGSVKRLFCRFFPFGTYEMTVDTAKGIAGFYFKLPDCEASIYIKGNELIYSCKDHNRQVQLPSPVAKDHTLIVSCRPGAFDIYVKINCKPQFLCTFYEKAFADSNDCDVFSKGYVFLYVSQKVVVKEVLSYIDNGVSIADIRPIKYENGDVLTEQGKIYFTASIRMQEGTFQGVFSWIPGTGEFQMTGALFYDSGDNKWRGYVAPVIIYHRDTKKWLVWVSSFEHHHILAQASFEGDPRFGVNVIDATIMERAPEGSDISVFAGFKGDEDPDIFYDEENRRWLTAICRIDPKTKSYVYVFFESNDPFSGHKYIGKGYDGAETGGSFVRINGDIHFICGNDFSATSEYRIYNASGMVKAEFNFPDGGFRGWGTVIPVKQGSRTRYFWLTFDRHNGSNYNWSYGNIYCFEGDMKNN